MINGDIREFVDTLFTGQDLEVVFRGKRYFIQGYCLSIGTDEQSAHMEMFDYEGMRSYDDYVWSKDGSSLSELATEFMHARVWDGKTLDEAESEIEWIG